VDVARGKYVILLHADDELEPRFLTRAVEVLNSNDDVALMSCAVEHIDERGSHLQLQELFDSDVVDREGVVVRRLLLEGCVINPAGVLVRRSAYESVGEFTDQVVWGVDWHMWTRIAMLAPVAYLAEPLARYRQHTASGTSGVMTSARNGKDEMWVLDDVFGIAAEGRPDLVKLRREARHGVADRTWWMAERMCQEGEMGAARTGLKNAIEFRPSLLTKGRTWALLAATFLGYGWFERAQARKRRHSPRRAS
jgi:hypothetical protein